jgi:hypothetical protein
VVDRDELRSLEREFPPLERWLYRCAHGIVAVVGRAVPDRLKAEIHNRRMGQIPKWTPTTWIEGRYRDILEVCDAQADSAAPTERGAVAD